VSSPLWDLRPDINSVRKLRSCLCGVPSLTICRVCLLSVTVSSICPRSSFFIFSIILFLIFTCHMFYVYTIYTRPLSAQAQYSRSCPILCSLRYNSSLNTWTVVSLTATKFQHLILLTELKLKLICDRRSVGQSVLVSGSHPELMTRFLFSVWQLRVSWCGAFSLTRGWVCNLHVELLLGLARATTHGPKFRRTHDHILLSHLRLPQSGGPGLQIYIPQEQGGPVKSPGIGFLFRHLYRRAELRWRYSNQPPHG
jgi:hypothetical protein